MKKKQISRNLLPVEMQEHWNAEEYLKESEESFTILVRENVSGILCVLKWGRKLQAEMLCNEMEILQKLTDMGLTGIPKAYRIFEENSGVYFLREYIEGTPLSQMVLQKGGIQERELCRISIKICRAAEQFQKLEDPMIHRDIKPENIVITHGGEVAFIDFGTMRSYKKDSQRDTFVVGTRGTAAPEQYGYNQTDQRTDVYAIGRTMLYMATESYELDQILECGVNRELKKIIKKACSFEPDKRYADAAELGRAIEKCQENNKKNGYKKAGAVVGLIAAGYVLAILFPGTTVIKNGRIIADNNVTEDQVSAENTQEEGTDQNTEQSQNPEQISDAKQFQDNQILFKEELIEAAVRKELNLSETDEITADMLENVRKLRIVGKEILDNEDGFWGIGHHIDGKDNNFGSVRGSITDLSDLTQMTNLEELALCNQRIEDISGLKDLPLKELYLSKNMITDFSVIQSLIDLDILCILENPAVDLSPLGDCGNISQLNIQGMHLTDIDFLKNMNLNYLDMNNAEVENGIFEPLTEMKNLDTLCMCNVNEAAAETLSKMSTLKSLVMWGGETSLEDLKPLKGMDELESLAFTAPISSLEGIEQFPSLNFLSVSFSLVKDLTPITGAENLQIIDISNAEIENYEALFKHTGLKEVRCSEEQKQEILKLNSSPDFEIYT
ncbi:protein kinase domain-containing protein [Blautia sp. MSJ-9]|uniref:protein kinase domain-containing protein n=1 Tax=Blautia sp. MSJ-9 TaxID=2841511 RepID=UPI001C0F5BF0|nr:protein kinase [Blautia sp. MSJ-9]MBU5679656.1 protein kinase [Blautia sp. MSJ-9]